MNDPDMFRAGRVLETLADDPEQLDRARRRFSVSPPFHKSPTPSSTAFNTPTPPTASEIQEEADLKERQRRQHSRPDRQWHKQISHEKEWLFQAEAKVGVQLPVGTEYEKLAAEMVKKRWEEQGIWNDRWDTLTDWCAWRWKHEEADTESESESIHKTGSGPCLPSLFKQTTTPPSPVAKAKPQLTPTEIEQHEKLDRDREASRPINQFLYELARQRDLISGEPALQQAAVSAPLDINTKAYEAVKSSWVRDNVWDAEWGILPGMTWMHERSPNQTVRPDPLPAHAREHSFAIAEVEAEARRLFPNPPTPPAWPDLTPFVDEYGLFGRSLIANTRADINGVVDRDADSREDRSPASSNPSPQLPDGAMIHADAVSMVERPPHSPNTSFQAPVNLDQGPGEPPNEVGSQRHGLRPSYSLPETQKSLRCRAEDPATHQQTQANQTHGSVRPPIVIESRAKKVLPTVHNGIAAEHLLSDLRSTTDSTIENEHAGGQRRSKRLRQGTEDDHGDWPVTNDQLQPPTKTIKQHKSNARAENEKLDDIGVAEAQRSTRRKEQKPDGVGTRPTRSATEL
ncbi:hypothetical protein XPA_003856 [Xanthoria parietina]